MTYLWWEYGESHYAAGKWNESEVLNQNKEGQRKLKKITKWKFRGAASQISVPTGHNSNEWTDAFFKTRQSLPQEVGREDRSLRLNLTPKEACPCPSTRKYWGVQQISPISNYCAQPSALFSHARSSRWAGSMQSVIRPVPPYTCVHSSTCVAR